VKIQGHQRKSSFFSKS